MNFFDLPPEIRVEIYTIILRSDEALPKELSIPPSIPSSMARLVRSPHLATANLLQCSRRINEELTACMRFHKSKGEAIHKLHVACLDNEHITCCWKRMTVPLRYVHALQIDARLVNKTFIRAFWYTIHKIIMGYFEWGPNLVSSSQTHSWPLLETVLIDIQHVKTLLSDSHTIDGQCKRPAFKPYSLADPLGPMASQITMLIDSNEFTKLRQYLGHYIRVIQVRYAGYEWVRTMAMNDGDISALPNDDF